MKVWRWVLLNNNVRLEAPRPTCVLGLQLSLHLCACIWFLPSCNHGQNHRIVYCLTQKIELIAFWLKFLILLLSWEIFSGGTTSTSLHDNVSVWKRQRQSWQKKPKTDKPPNELNVSGDWCCITNSVNVILIGNMLIWAKITGKHWVARTL